MIEDESETRGRGTRWEALPFPRKEMVKVMEIKKGNRSERLLKVELIVLENCSGVGQWKEGKG